MTEFRSDHSLREATAQEIQLELLRRTRHNALDGEQIVESLLKHRDLWLAVLLDRLYVWTRTDYDLPLGNFMKLRDLPYNDWNANTLYILTDEREKAIRLAQIAEEEDWAGEVRVFDDPEQVARSVGSGRDEHFLVRIWWD